MDPTDSPPPAQGSAGLDELTSSPQSLHRAVHARRSEYVHPQRVRIKIGTWNVAAFPGADKDLSRWFVSGGGADSRLASIQPRGNPAIEGDEQGSPDKTEDDGPVRLLGDDRIGLYVLGLQEVVDLGPSQYLGRVVAEDPTRGKWKAAVEAALPEGYRLLSCEQMSGLLLLIYASPEIAATVSNVSSCCIGTGMMGGWIGNKGAVTTRILLGETTKMTFTNCHLASGHESAACERRIWDVGQILSRTRLEPISLAGVSEEDNDTVDDQDFAFWFGDLNFRLDSLPGDDIRRLLMLHTRGEYDLSSKGGSDLPEGEGVIIQGSRDSSGDEASDTEAPTAPSTEQNSDDDSSVSLPDPDEFETDARDNPASLQATLGSLLPHDQLKRMMKAGKAFHQGWREGDITFLPTYKYDVGTVGLFDSSEKKRAPSWCDRILYRTRPDKERYEKKVIEREEARKKDEEMKARGLDDADDDDVLFDYEPEGESEVTVQGKAGLEYDEYDEEEEEVGSQAVPKEGSADRLHLDTYTSHQRIVSSDHKPVTSIFTLDYDAVVPELKAKIHAQVARELDRAENEGRPAITLVIDGSEASARADGRADEDLSNHAVDFGEVRLSKKATATLTLANTGGVPATFAFVEKPTTEEPGGSPSVHWLTTSFARPDADGSESQKEITLEPGDTVKALLHVCVHDIRHARMLNDGQARLEDVLVLRIRDGRDHFIPVRAAWSPTCIGRSIDELIRVPDGGLKEFAASRSRTNSGLASISYDLPVHHAAPKELFKLTEAVETLTERVLADQTMLEGFRVPQEAGWPLAHASWKCSNTNIREFHTARIIDALDGDGAIADAFDPETPSLERLESVCEVLLLFLESLTDGIVPISLWARIERAPLTVLGQGGAATKQPNSQTADDDRAAVLDILSSAPNHNIAFVFLTATLAQVLSEIAPLSQTDLDELKSSGLGLGAFARRSLTFGRGGSSDAAAALARRQAKEHRFAEILGKVVCRAVAPEKDKERRSLEDRQRAVLELFLKRRGDV